MERLTRMANYKDPDHIVYQGKRYDINTDYRTALRALEITNDPTISDTERTLAVIYVLFGTIPDTADGIGYFLEKAKKYLQIGEAPEKHETRKRDMDLEYDWGLIQASFESDYGIDLSTTQMHWWRFWRLLSGLTEQAVLSRVRMIRTWDTSDLPEKSKREIRQMQESVALPDPKEELTAAEQAAVDEFEALLNLKG